MDQAGLEFSKVKKPISRPASSHSVLTEEIDQPISCDTS
jgi:hypothetical protein